VQDGKPVSRLGLAIVVGIWLLCAVVLIGVVARYFT
jgi:hypothetical protein